jgi:type IV pilus assembly protein PilA
MLHKLSRRAQDEQGFTLIELLVVILIIGILAAIAIPAFLNQRQKAYDASAKSNVKTAQTAEETYATDNNGTYASDTLTSTDTGSLATIEPTLKNSPFVTATANGTTGYTLTATAASSGDVYSMTSTNGAVVRSCTNGTGSTACSGGSW